jgi:hypothetical protein
MKAIFLVLFALSLGCNHDSVPKQGSISSKALEEFFRDHKIEGNFPAAIKKRNDFGISYIATVHGYPNNMLVAQDIVNVFNKNPSLSAIPGTYYCEELR